MKRRLVPVLAAFAALAVSIYPAAAAPIAADGKDVTRVTVHRDGTAREVFKAIAGQGGVPLEWSGPNDGPRRRFDAENEPFWSAVHRACAAFEAHVDVGELPAVELRIAPGAVTTRPASPLDAPITLFTQEPASFVRMPSPHEEGRDPEIQIRLVACFDPALAGDIAAYSDCLHVEEALGDDGQSLLPMFHDASGRFFGPPQRVLVMPIHVPTRIRPPARRLARLRGTMWFVTLHKSESVDLELKDGSAGPVDMGGATVRVGRIAKAPAGRRDFRLRIDRGALGEGSWELIRPQICSLIEVSPLTRNGRGLDPLPATQIYHLSGWRDTSTSLDAVLRFVAYRPYGLFAEEPPVAIRVILPTDTTRVEVPLRLTDIDLPELPGGED